MRGRVWQVSEAVESEEGCRGRACHAREEGMGPWWSTRSRDQAGLIVGSTRQCTSHSGRCTHSVCQGVLCQAHTHTVLEQDSATGYVSGRRLSMRLWAVGCRRGPKLGRHCHSWWLAAGVSNAHAVPREGCVCTSMFSRVVAGHIVVWDACAYTSRMAQPRHCWIYWDGAQT